MMKFEDIPRSIDFDERRYLYSASRLFRKTGLSNYYLMIKARLFMLCEDGILSLEQAIALEHVLIDENSA